MNEFDGNQETLFRNYSDSQPKSIVVWWCPQCEVWSGHNYPDDLASMVNRGTAMRGESVSTNREVSMEICTYCRVQGKESQRIQLNYVSFPAVITIIETAIKAAGL